MTLLAAKIAAVLPVISSEGTHRRGAMDGRAADLSVPDKVANENALCDGGQIGKFPWKFVAILMPSNRAADDDGMPRISACQVVVTSRLTFSVCPRLLFLLLTSPLLSNVRPPLCKGAIWAIILGSPTVLDRLRYV